MYSGSIVISTVKRSALSDQLLLSATLLPYSVLVCIFAGGETRMMNCSGSQSIPVVFGGA